MNIHDYQKPNHIQKIESYNEEKYEYIDHFVIIDSRDRDRGIYPNPNSYVVRFDNGTTGNVAEEFRNVVAIKLVECILPTTTDSQPYLILDIPELSSQENSSYAGTNFNLSKAFAILLPEVKTTYSKCKTSEGIINTFKVPLASLTRFTIQFKTYDNTLFPFVSEPLPGGMTNTNQNQLIFKITTKNKKIHKFLEPIMT